MESFLDGRMRPVWSDAVRVILNGDRLFGAAGMVSATPDPLRRRGRAGTAPASKMAPGSPRRPVRLGSSPLRKTDPGRGMHRREFLQSGRAAADGFCSACGRDAEERCGSVRSEIERLEKPLSDWEDPDAGTVRRPLRGGTERPSAAPERGEAVRQLHLRRVPLPFVQLRRQVRERHGVAELLPSPGGADRDEAGLPALSEDRYHCVRCGGHRDTFQRRPRPHGKRYCNNACPGVVPEGTPSGAAELTLKRLASSWRSSRAGCHGGGSRGERDASDGREIRDATFAGDASGAWSPFTRRRGGLHTVGYTGGDANPTYERSPPEDRARRGDPVVFDPAKSPTAAPGCLLAQHRSLARDRQFCDVGSSTQRHLLPGRGAAAGGGGVKAALENRTVPEPILTQILRRRPFTRPRITTRTTTGRTGALQVLRFSCGRDQRLKDLWAPLSLPGRGSGSLTRNGPARTGSAGEARRALRGDRE